MQEITTSEDFYELLKHIEETRKKGRLKEISYVRHYKKEATINWRFEEFYARIIREMESQFDVKVVKPKEKEPVLQLLACLFMIPDEEYEKFTKVNFFKKRCTLIEPYLKEMAEKDLTLVIWACKLIQNQGKNSYHYMDTWLEISLRSFRYSNQSQAIFGTFGKKEILSWYQSIEKVLEKELQRRENLLEEILREGVDGKRQEIFDFKGFEEETQTLSESIERVYDLLNLVTRIACIEN